MDAVKEELNQEFRSNDFISTRICEPFLYLTDQSNGDVLARIPLSVVELQSITHFPIPDLRLR